MFILDHLDVIEASVRTLRDGWIEAGSLSLATMGGHTAGMLLGAQLIDD